jgi:nitrogen fixation/metabolism regulation signal transduction histidine kinase
MKNLELEWKILIFACLVFVTFAWPLQQLFAFRLETTLKTSVDPGLEPLLRSGLQASSAARRDSLVAAIERSRQWRVMLPMLVKEQRQTAFAFSAVFFILMVVAALWTLRRLTRPLKVLASAVTRMGNGERAAIAVSSGGALGRLERAVNGLQEELEVLRKQAHLQGMEKAWQDIARVMAHEIKNPLTPIRLSLDRMEEKAIQGDTIDPATSKKFCERIGEQVDALERLVNQFRSFSKDPEICPSETAIESAVLTVAESMGDRIKTSISGCARLRTDPYLLNQVLLNIWKNAMEAGANLIRADITPASGGCELIVRDNGPGIAPDLVEKVWLPYVSFKKGGTGLGLPVVKKIVETLGGTIKLASHYSGGETGLTLHIVLPEISSGRTKEVKDETHDINC